MPGRWRRSRFAWALLAAGLAVVPAAAGQDKPVLVADTDPAPAVIDGGTFFLASGLVAMKVRNRHTAPVLVRLRGWVFDQDGRLRGTSSYCVPEPLDRGTRRAMTMTLDVQGIQRSDDVVVAVDAAASDRRRWLPTGDGVAEARRVHTGFPVRLRLEERAGGVPSDAFCPCDCDAVAAACESGCAGAAPRAFTCTPVMLEGCSASCTCR